MPTSPKKICAWPGCYTLTSGERHCIKHTEAYRTRRRKTAASKPGDPFYGSTAWQKIRRAKISDCPLCERCEAAGRTTAATEVHHKQARQDAPHLELDYENLESICPRCHRLATVEAMRARKQ